jgi:hypothetical protein
MYPWPVVPFYTKRSVREAKIHQKFRWVIEELNALLLNFKKTIKNINIHNSFYKLLLWIFFMKFENIISNQLSHVYLVSELKSPIQAIHFYLVLHFF